MTLHLTSIEKNKYLLPEKRDFLILEKCKKMEKDWRKHLIKKLDQLLKKY